MNTKQAKKTGGENIESTTTSQTVSPTPSQTSSNYGEKAGKLYNKVKQKFSVMKTSVEGSVDNLRAKLSGNKKDQEVKPDENSSEKKEKVYK